MAHPRKNKCRSSSRENGGAAWFCRNVQRSRRREELAIQSRRKNRKA